VVLACAPDENHNLGLITLQSALGEAGVQTLMLGPAVSSPVLVEVVARARPAAVVVSSQRERTARPDQLRPLTGLTPVVLAAGAGWTGRRLPTGVQEAAEMSAALRTLRSAAGA
jgi:hypothetical protein